MDAKDVMAKDVMAKDVMAKDVMERYGDGHVAAPRAGRGMKLVIAGHVDESGAVAPSGS